MLAEAPVPDFEGPVRPAAGDRMDPTVIQSEADEQFFNNRGCRDWILNDRFAFVIRKVRLSEERGCPKDEAN